MAHCYQNINLPASDIWDTGDLDPEDGLLMDADVQLVPPGDGPEGVYNYIPRHVPRQDHGVGMHVGIFYMNNFIRTGAWKNSEFPLLLIY